MLSMYSAPLVVSLESYVDLLPITMLPTALYDDCTYLSLHRSIDT